MKRHLLVAILSILSFVGFSQTLELSYGSHSTIINYGDTIIAEDSANVGEIIAAINVKNLDVSSHDIFCKKEYIDTVPGTYNYFCWGGSCLPPYVFSTTTATTIESGATSTEFSAHYQPNSNGGITIVKYTFSVLHGDSAHFFVKYIGLTGVSDNELSYSISNLYPNPATNNAYINYSIPFGSDAVVALYDVCGKLEQEYVLTDNMGILSLDLSQLPAGVYFYSINANGKIVKSDKLIVIR